MARPLRIDVAGGIVHVTARGNNRAAIFPAAEHRDRFVATLGRVVERYSWICHAYVVMDNHYHLLIETPLPNLSVGMRQLNGLYAQWFNRRHTEAGMCSRDGSSRSRSSVTSTFSKQPGTSF